MNHSQIAKRQSRILIVSVAVVAVFASVLILLTALSGKDRREEDPPLSQNSGSVSTVDPGTDTPRVYPEDTTAPAVTDKPTGGEIPEDTADTDAAAANTPADVLPDFISPVSGVIAKSHSVEVPVYSLTMDDYRTHNGVDIAAEAGTAVRAAAAGTVKEIWDDPMMGKCLSITHSGGAVSIYKNLAAEIPSAITAGAAVEAGTVIGAVGESALIETAESPHLHFELQINGIDADPADFMLFGTTDVSFED